jgi:hypothetical protein
MVKTNYQAWHIDDSKFDKSMSATDKLLHFARYAILAPSGHNTQPWLLSTKGNALFLAIHPGHHLSIDGSGLLSVEPYISIGTFLSTLRLAARGFGYELNITLFPDNKHVAQIEIKKEVQAESALLDAITSRVSNRHPFDTTPLDQKELSHIVSGTFDGVTTKLITERSDIEFIGDMTEAAIGSIMSKPLYRRELSNWVRTNQTRKYDGMPGFTHGFSNIQSLVSKAAVKHAPVGGPQGKKSKHLVLQSASLLIVSCNDDRKESFINAGQVYSQVSTLAAMAGIATSALGASVLDPVTRQQVKERFGINERPIYVLRLGKTDQSARHSPRWPLEKLIDPRVA